MSTFNNPKQSKRRGPKEESVFPHWALRMFLSVDMVGSTAYKHGAAPIPLKTSSRRPLKSAERPGPHWLPTFAEFYSAFSDELDTSWSDGLEHIKAAGKRAISIGDVGPPQFWKSAGDELLFQTLVTSPSHAGFALDAFRLAIIRYREKLSKANRRLNLKATAWLAGFPVNNIEVVIGAEPEWMRRLSPALADDHITRMLLRTRNKLEGKEKDEGQLEFIGPQMDLGFRLAAHATPRQMVISADLAFLLVNRHKESYGFQPNHMNTKVASEGIRFLGKQTLKGILGGIPYPIFWIDSDPNDLNKAEDHMLSPNEPSKPHIKDYCEEFFKACGESWVVRPFIWERKLNKPTFGEAPEGHGEVRKGYSSYLEGRERALRFKLNPEDGDGGTDRPQPVSDRLMKVQAVSRGRANDEAEANR